MFIFSKIMINIVYTCDKNSLGTVSVKIDLFTLHANLNFKKNCTKKNFLPYITSLQKMRDWIKKEETNFCKLKKGGDKNKQSFLKQEKLNCIV
jgi:hypothetical protein